MNNLSILNKIRENVTYVPRTGTHLNIIGDSGIMSRDMYDNSGVYKLVDYYTNDKDILNIEPSSCYIITSILSFHHINKGIGDMLYRFIDMMQIGGIMYIEDYNLNDLDIPKMDLLHMKYIIDNSRQSRDVESVSLINYYSKSDIQNYMEANEMTIIKYNSDKGKNMYTLIGIKTTPPLTTYIIPATPSTYRIVQKNMSEWYENMGDDVREKLHEELRRHPLGERYTFNDGTVVNSLDDIFVRSITNKISIIEVIREIVDNVKDISEEIKNTIKLMQNGNIEPYNDSYLYNEETITYLYGEMLKYLKITSQTVIIHKDLESSKFHHFDNVNIITNKYIIIKDKFITNKLTYSISSYYTGHARFLLSGFDQFWREGNEEIAKLINGVINNGIIEWKDNAEELSNKINSIAKSYNIELHDTINPIYIPILINEAISELDITLPENIKYFDIPSIWGDNIIAASLFNNMDDNRSVQYYSNWKVYYGKDIYKFDELYNKIMERFDLDGLLFNIKSEQLKLEDNYYDIITCSKPLFLNKRYLISKIYLSSLSKTINNSLSVNGLVIVYGRNTKDIPFVNMFINENKDNLDYRMLMKINNIYAAIFTKPKLS